MPPRCSPGQASRFLKNRDNDEQQRPVWELTPALGCLSKDCTALLLRNNLQGVGIGYRNLRYLINEIGGVAIIERVRRPK